jgi:flagellar hook-basal body complex protein FliE
VSTTTPIATNAGVGKVGQLNLEIQAPERGGLDSADGAQFRAALERHMSAMSGAAPGGPGGKPSLSEKVVGRVTNLAGNIQKDQQYVSKLLEHATRTGDSMQLMKAMMAMNDYQIRVQTITKTVSKSTQAFEQLTKLQ